MSRKLTVISNWKLNGSLDFISTFVNNLKQKISPKANVIICPPAIYLPVVSHILSNCNIRIGAQDCSTKLSGAYTGDCSASHIKDVGGSHVIIGHSERRQYHHETNQLIAEKFATAKSVGLVPILCIGETLEEHEAGKAEFTCAKQIKDVIDYVGIDAFDGAIIAYEPVWAIGTGKSATPEHAQKLHKFIRNVLAQYDSEVANRTSILYGGSVNAENANNYFTKPDIDGALVGGAGLKEEFCLISDYCVK